MSDLDDTDLTLRWIDDAEFERVVLDRGDRECVTAVLFCRPGTPEADRAAEVFAEAAYAADRAFLVDVSAQSSQGTLRRFAIGTGPLLMLFLGGTFRSVFPSPQFTAAAVENWIERQGPAA